MTVLGCHYEYRGERRPVTPETPQNKGFSRAEAPGSGGFTPNMGYRRCESYTASDSVPVVVDGQLVGQFPVSGILP